VPIDHGPGDARLTRDPVDRHRVKPAFIDDPGGHVEYLLAPLRGGHPGLFARGGGHGA
jgi:hypothetical protein